MRQLLLTVISMLYQGCYGVPDDAGAGDDKSSVSSFTTIPWFCDTCKAGVNPLTCVSVIIITYILFPLYYFHSAIIILVYIHIVCVLNVCLYVLN